MATSLKPQTRQAIVAVSFALLCLAISVYAFYAKKLRPFRYWALSNPCVEFHLESPEYKWFRPGCVTKLDGWLDYSINEAGLRDRPLSELRGRRVLFLGNSFVEGLGIQQSETLPSQLTALSREFSVLNAGLAMSSVGTELERARRLVPITKPELLLWGISDLDRVNERFFSRLAKRDGTGRLTGYEMPPELASRIYRYQRLREFWAGFDFLRHFTFSAARDQLAADYSGPDPMCGAVEEAKKFARAQNLPLVFVILPNHGSIGSPELDRVVNECHNMIPRLDLRGLLPDRTFYLEDAVHFSAEGSKHVALLLHHQLPELFPAWQ